MFKTIGAAAATANLPFEFKIAEKKEDMDTNNKKGKVILLKSVASLNFSGSLVNPGEIKIQTHPFLIIYKIVLIDDFILVLSVISRFLFIGTLKSTLSKTFLLFKSNCVINIKKFFSNLIIVFILQSIRL